MIMSFKKYILCLFGFFILGTLYPQEQQTKDIGSSGGPVLSAKAAVLLDAATGSVLYTKNPDLPLPPASLTKLMAMHIALSQSAALGISLDERFEVPEEGWWRNQPPRSSLMHLDRGQVVSLRELLLGLVIPSGNDAAVAVALRFSPTIDDFAAKMNAEARRLGLKTTSFVEASGISEKNSTTALEFAEFCRLYIKLHPETLKEYHTVEEFVYPKVENLLPTGQKRAQSFVYRNHIGLVGSYPGADGLKTGYIDEVGYNLAVTAQRDGTRFIAVILGVPTELGAYRGPQSRDADGKALLDWAFNNYKTLYIEYPVLEDARIWKGTQNHVKVLPEIPSQDSPVFGAFTVKRDRGVQVYYDLEMFKGLVSPLPAASVAGVLTFSDSLGEIARIPLLTSAPVEKGNIFKQIWDTIVMFFLGIKIA
jgi:D-alanyl-D-alanine carboxypeptidase (penicillin-binding protein 5/6)